MPPSLICLLAFGIRRRTAHQATMTGRASAHAAKKNNQRLRFALSTALAGTLAGVRAHPPRWCCPHLALTLRIGPRKLRRACAEGHVALFHHGGAVSCDGRRKQGQMFSTVPRWQWRGGANGMRTELPGRAHSTSASAVKFELTPTKLANRNPLLCLKSSSRARAFFT